MYVTAALAERPGPPIVPAGRGWHLESTRQGVGTLHAAANTPSPLAAVCGADITGWVVLGESPFVPGHPASCQRCAQLLAPR